MNIEACKAYEIIEKREIGDLQSMSYLLRHKKTGARVALLSNEDDNKVFYIGFRTPPNDSTGVAHILEHSVLCGSKQFPVKDPFIELAKGSLNTFLNAMTYPDKTVYPVASCNDKDFQNLLHVYLDAVFYPNIYKEEKIFRQEGWHYQLEAEADELQLNGVVYNEMKGAFSSPDDMFDREVFNSLFPDTPYSFESGGDPDCIPELTYEDFLEFHRKYYHPSNSYLYLYGNMDMEEKLNWIDEQYLSRFHVLSIDSKIREQEAFRKPVEVKKEYPITDSEPVEGNAYLSYNVVVENSLDKELYVAFQVLDYALCSAPGAPLKQALLDKGIGRDVYSVYENGIKQPYFSIVAKNADLSAKEEFLSTIQQVLSQLCEKGMDEKALKAALNYFEFKYREADFGSYPKGLMYGLQMLDSWLYDEGAAFLHVEAKETFRMLRKKVGTGYFEGLIQKYLLDNPHKSVVLLEPVRNLLAKKEQEWKEKLAAYKASLGEKELLRLIEETKALAEYQETPNDEEALKSIPLLNREDMKKEAEPFVNREEILSDTKVLYHDYYTNGIGYVKLLFDIGNLPEELFAWLGLYKAVLGLMDTEYYAYGDFYNEMNMHTGGIATAVNTYVEAENTEICRVMFEVRVKTFYENLPKAFTLMEEMMFSTCFEDEKRLLEIISETKSRMQASFVSAGHSLAAVRAMSYFSKPAAVSEQMNGLPLYRLLEALEGDFENRKAEAVSKLEALTRHIFRTDTIMVDYTGEACGKEALSACIHALKGRLFTEPVDTVAYEPKLQKKNEGLMCSSQIQYVCRAGNYIKKGFSYTGALKVLKVMLGYDYLWNQVRVRGGAYGCMCNFGRSGDSYFVSYRDPNLKRTIEVYEEAVDYVKSFSADERTLTKYIIGAISEMDTPLNPSAKGSRSLSAYMSRLAFSKTQEERDQVLDVTVEDIRALAAYLEAFMSYECLCVVGNEGKIEACREMFEKVESLFGNGESA